MATVLRILLSCWQPLLFLGNELILCQAGLLFIDCYSVVSVDELAFYHKRLLGAIAQSLGEGFVCETFLYLPKPCRSTFGTLYSLLLSVLSLLWEALSQ
jgi:hypothetical protein